MTICKELHLDKALYQGGGFSRELERLDPSADYAGTGLEGLDAFQRQLKRFDIQVGGAHSDAIEKFFQTSDSACLFPEYVSRAVAQGMADGAQLADLAATTTDINGLDYRSVSADFAEADRDAPVVAEGAAIPDTVIALNETLVKLKKRGRMISASYEAIRFQRLDLFTVLLRRIGAYIARARLGDAVECLLEGTTPIQSAAAGALAYPDLLALWGAFGAYELNTLVASPAMVQRLLALDEMKDAAAGLAFHGTGRLITPFGAKIVKTGCVADDTLIALDRRFALEMVTAGGVQVDYDKLINTQLERAAVTSIAGFGKIFPDAVRVLQLKTA